MFGLEDAEGVGLEVIAGEGVGAGAGAAADLAVGAAAAFAFEEVRGAELAEEGGVAVNIDEFVGADVACGDGEEATGVDFAGVGDEDEAAAVGEALHAGGIGFCEAALEEDAAVVMAFGGFDAEGELGGEGSEFVEEIFGFLGGDEVVGMGAACGDEEEDAPGGGLNLE